MSPPSPPSCSPLRHASHHPLFTCRPFVLRHPSRRLHAPSPWDTPCCCPFACHPQLLLCAYPGARSRARNLSAAWLLVGPLKLRISFGASPSMLLQLLGSV